MATEGNEYKFLFIAKGGGSTNKIYLYQETEVLLTEKRFFPFLVEEMRSLGTAACPPYHTAFVVGDTSAEVNLRTVKLASAKYYDKLPTKDNKLGRAFYDLEMGRRLPEATHEIGLGAQSDGKHFAHNIHVIYMPRHGASCPAGLGVSRSAGRNVRAKINKDGLWVERLEKHPARPVPEPMRHSTEDEIVKADLSRPIGEICKQLSQYPVSTRLSLSGTIIVDHDIAHAKLKECLDRGGGLPQYIKGHPTYYAGPAKTSEGMPSDSFGPTTAGHMDPYVDLFQSHGGSLIMIAKGNRSQQVMDACKARGGFYLDSINGPATTLVQESIKRVECLEYPKLGMEVIWRIGVENFPALTLVDDEGNDLLQQIRQCTGCPRG